MGKKICIIIPTHNRKEALRRLLKQINNQSKPLKYLEINIVVIVDGSNDGTLEMIHSNFSNVHLIEGDGSWWYTKSMNEGFKYAELLQPDLALTLNDDVLIDNDYFASLISDYLTLQRDCILGSISFSNENQSRIVSSGNSWKNKLIGSLKPHIPILSVLNPEDLSGIKKTETLPGRGMLIPWKILKELNFFDEKFVQYHSDGDFCLRAKKRGYPVYVSWNSKVYISIEKTSYSTSYLNKSFRLAIKSFFNRYSRNYLPAKLYFSARHQSLLLAPIIILIFIFVVIRNVLYK